MASLESYEKKKDYLICVDSDGCAMDTMDIKHIRCFGPCMVEEWQLGKWRTEILDRWNEINLYSMTRGINRFKGLGMALKEIHEKYRPIEGIDDLVKWAEEAPELSNRAVEEVLNQTGKDVFAKALSWSKSVNQSINALPDEVKKPFEGVAEGLKTAHSYADVVVVSSANRDAVEEEWEKYGLMDQVDILLCQDVGSKAYCIGELCTKGYAKDHILMVGDAPGDLDAAKKNGVYFYPILVRREAESWSGIEAAIKSLTGGSYGEMQPGVEQAFRDNLQK